MTTQGNWARTFIQGLEVTADLHDITYTHEYGTNKVMPENTGLEQYNLGAYKPQLQLAGYTRRGGGVASVHNLLAPQTVGAATDTEWLVTIPVGNNKPPTTNDPVFVFDGTRFPYKRPDPASGSDVVQKYDVTFKPRGKRWPMMTLHYDNSALNSTVTVVVDDQANFPTAPGATTFGGTFFTNVYNPTQPQASGYIGLTGLPAANDAFVIAGTTYTFVASLTVANQILIGATAYATMQNLYAALVGDPMLSGIAYAAGTTALATNNLLTSTFFIAPPVAATGRCAITVNNYTGTAGTMTLVASPNVSTNLVVSGATIANVGTGSYAVVVSTGPTAGGGWTAIGYSPTLTLGTAARFDIAAGVNIQRYFQYVITKTGSTPIGLNISFGRYWS